MKEPNPIFQIGEIVEVLMGREHGRYMVVLGLQNRYLILADGDKRKFDQPKKKNIRHVRSTGFIAKEVVDSLEENGRVSNAKLRYVLQNYLSNQIITDEKKGE